MILNKQFFEKALPSSICSLGEADGEFSNENKISIDSRTIKPGEIFLALKGPNFDGHDFISEVLDKGASTLIIHKDKKNLLSEVDVGLLKGKRVILVADTLLALIEMAKCWRQSLGGKIIGITGSLGKTTTKEMLGSILRESKIPSYISFKNQNNIIGLCLNILKVKANNEVAVFEVGINHKGEMDLLADVLRPDIAVITSIAHVHTEGLGSLDGVAEEKRLIMKHFCSSDIGVIPGDCGLLANSYYKHPIIKFGLKKRNQVQAKRIKTVRFDEDGVSFSLRIFNDEFKLSLMLGNEALVKNALAAVAIATLISLPAEKIIKGLENFKPVEGRFEKKLLKNNSGILINDCYNASPESMKEALLAFHKMQARGPKSAVLGDMLELGKKEAFWHRQIGRSLCNMLSINHLIIVGDRAKTIASTAPLTMKVTLSKDWKEACKSLNKILEKDSLILLNGSKAVGLSNIVGQII